MSKILSVRLRRRALSVLVHAGLLNYQKKVGVSASFDDDVYIVSFPRSGNTLTRFLLANMLADGEVNFANIEKLVPDIHVSAGLIDDLARPRFIKTHDPFFKAYPRMIYIYRDGRDAMISYYNYQVQGGKFAGSFSDYLRSDAHTFYEAWETHVGTALAYAERHPDKVLLLKFETLVADMEAAGKAIIAFGGLAVDDEKLKAAADACAFKELQKSEAKVPRHHGENAPTMFRAGSSGTWADTFSSDDLAYFMAKAGPTMAKLGYV